MKKFKRVLSVCSVLLIILICENGCTTEAKSKPKFINSRYECIEKTSNGCHTFLTIKDKDTGREYLIVDAMHGTTMIELNKK